MPSNIAYAGRVPSELSAGAQLGKRTGSLADACSLLNAEVEQLEAATKNLYERANPFLEPPAPQENIKTGEARSSSPLAESIFEYVGRIRRQREALEEMASRIAY